MHVDGIFKVSVLREIRLQLSYNIAVILGEVRVQSVLVDPLLLQIALRVLFYVSNIIANLLQLILDVVQVNFVLSYIIR